MSETEMKLLKTEGGGTLFAGDSILFSVQGQLNNPVSRGIWNLCPSAWLEINTAKAPIDKYSIDKSRRAGNMFWTILPSGKYPQNSMENPQWKWITFLGKPGVCKYMIISKVTPPVLFVGL